MKKIILFMFIFSINASAELKGVLLLNVLDINNNVLAKATGFVVFNNYKKYVLTSFHLLNINIVLAEKVIDERSGKEFEVFDYDEEYDLLVLDGQNYNDYFDISKNCNGSNKSVVGYYKGSQRHADVGKSKKIDIYEKGLKSINTYLPAGFSGSPVLNANAQVCGLTVLSSEGNSNSVYVDQEVILEKLETVDDTVISLHDIRSDLGIEFEINTSSELSEFLANKDKYTQKIVLLNPRNIDESFKINNTENLIIKSKKAISKLTITNSANINVSGLFLKNGVSVNNSHFVTITACKFFDSASVIKLKNSSNLEISYNSFKNIKGIIMSEDLPSNKIFKNYAYLNKENI